MSITTSHYLTIHIVIPPIYYEHHIEKIWRPPEFVKDLKLSEEMKLSLKSNLDSERA
jgi:hypothetical protein